MKLEKFEADNVDLGTVQVHLTLSPLQESLRFAENVNKLVGEEISIEVDKERKKRSLTANGLLWTCIGEIAKASGTDKDSVYREMLKRYGKYTYVCIPPQAVEMLKAQWKESEYIGDININGKPASQMLCYFGSSTYNSKEFSVLLDGVIDEMHQMGLQTPTEKEKDRLLEKWAKEVEDSA